MHKLLETDHEIRFAVESPRAITATLVDGAYVPGKSLRLTYPWISLEPGQFESFLNDYIVRLGLVTPRWSYRGSDAVLGVQQAVSDRAAKLAVLDSFDRADSPSAVEGFTRRNELEKLVNRRNTRLVEIEGRAAAHAVIEVLKDFSGVHRAQLGWLWLNRQLSRTQRRQTLASLAAASRQIVPGPLFAQVYAGNFPSLKTALNSGYKSLCATFTRRQP